MALGGRQARAARRASPRAAAALNSIGPRSGCRGSSGKIAAALLAEHAAGVLLALISQEACFLKDSAAGLDRLDLTGDFVGHRPSGSPRRSFMFLISTFHAEGSLGRAAPRMFTSQRGSFLHVAVAGRPDNA